MKIGISFLIVIVTIYLLFCIWLTGVALPNDDSRYRFRFTEEPKGFIKYSRILGNLILIIFVILIIVAITYGIIFKSF